VGLLGGGVGIAIVVVVVAIVISTSGGATHNTKVTGKDTGSKVPYATYVNNELKGIPQNGITLGRANAPVTLVWFGDLQCPICREFHAAVFSTLVNNYVRTGKVKLVWRNLAFIGPDSTTAAQMAGAAGAQNKEWNFVSLFYYNQQEENSGYVTTNFIKEIASGAGLNVNEALTDRFSPTVSAEMTAASQLANNTLPQIATPSFLIGKTGGQLTYFNYTALDPAAFTGPLNQLLKS